MDLTPNPIIVPMTVASNNQAVPMTAASNEQTVLLDSTADIRPMPNITIGEVESGEEASATMTGTSTNPVLNLVLPKGEKVIREIKEKPDLKAQKAIKEIGANKVYKAYKAKKEIKAIKAILLKLMVKLERILC